jgi:hypothetical protein
MNGDNKYNPLQTHKQPEAFNSESPYGFTDITETDRRMSDEHLDKLIQSQWHEIFNGGE